MRNKTVWAIWLFQILLIGVIISADMLTKKFIYGALVENGGGAKAFIPGLIRFLPLKNTGASFGIFDEHTNVLSIVSFIAITIFLLVLLASVNYHSKLFKSAMILIVGGGLGNCIDRFQLGYVRDFIDFEFMDFAVFNVADSCLSIGTALLVLFLLLSYKSEVKPKKPKTAEGNNA